MDFIKIKKLIMNAHLCSILERERELQEDTGGQCLAAGMLWEERVSQWGTL